MKRAEQLLRAYRASCYFAGAHAARIGQRAPGLDALLRSWRLQEGVFIAAGNPFSRRHPYGWNARRHTALRERLRRLHYVEGRGGTKRWWEAHCFIGISAARGRRLARLFRQNAMVALRRGAKARLIWLF
ncbi:MAG: DUF3293 domain-containing protein [Alphaproteobacteria bacterium]|nr:DUF3293 domain-containing protein [Alphaproteobacteria bacterium]